jgi:hypothetical protein
MGNPLTISGTGEWGINEMKRFILGFLQKKLPVVWVVPLRRRGTRETLKIGF